MGLAVAFAIATAAWAHGAAPAAPPKGAPSAANSPAGAPLKLKTVSLMIGHRAFTDFRDDVSVRPHTLFRVGDTEYSAKVVEFQPDFAMDVKKHKITSRSNEPKNPAVKIVVWKNGAADDTSWAFLNMPPHFMRKSMLAFRLVKLEFENGRVIEAPKDTTAVRTGSAHK